METRANTTAVGLFTLVTIAVAIGVVYWFNRYGEDDGFVPLDVRIQGSVTGLARGSGVQFNGIGVGRVDRLRVDPDDPRVVIVRVLVRPETPVRSDTRASVGLRGLSGAGFIQLEGGSPDAQALLRRESDEPVPALQGDPAALQDLLNRVNGIAARVEGVATTLETVIARNEDNLNRTVENVARFSDALAENSDGVGEFLESAGTLATSLGELSGKLDGTITQAEAILNAVDVRSVGETVENVRSFTEGLGRTGTDIERIVATVERTSRQLSTFTVALNQTLASVDGLVGAVPQEQLTRTFDAVERATTSASNVLDAVDPQTVRQAVSELSAASANLNRLSGSIDPERLAAIVGDAAEVTRGARAVTDGLSAQTVTKITDDAAAAVAGARQLVEGDAAAAVASARRIVDEDLAGAVAGARAAVEALPAETVRQVAEDVAVTTRSARGLVEGIEPGRVRALIDDLAAASRNVAALSAGIDASKVNGAVDNVAEAARDARGVVADVRKVTEPFGARAADVDRIVTDAGETARRLNETAAQAQALVARVDRLVGEASGAGLVAEAQATLAQFRRTARDLGAQVGNAAGSIQRLTDRGLQDTGTLVRNAGRSLERLERVIRNIESNPSSLISGSGGSRVRETRSGRPRR